MRRAGPDSCLAFTLLGGYHHLAAASARDTAGLVALADFFPGATCD